MAKTEIIRRPDRAEGGITPAEKARMDEHAKLWIKRAFRTDPIEHDKITPAIEGLYAAAGLKKPRVIIVPSPLVMAFAYGAAAAIYYARGRARPQKALAKATDQATYQATLKPDPRAETQAAFACLELAGKLGLECAKNWANVYQGGNMWAYYDCYLTAARDILGLQLAPHAAYKNWEEAAIHGGFRVLHPEFCMVSDFPEVLKADDQNRPHCETGPSHRWRDGWSLYHWHGVKIPGEWIEDRASLTAEKALTCPNVEQRRAACEILGWAKILSALDAKTIDKDEDPEIGELVEVSIPDSGRERFLRVLCGTGREFALPVPRNMKTALQAQAWTWDLDTKTFIKPELRT